MMTYNRHAMPLAAYNFRQMQWRLIVSEKLQDHNKHPVYGIPYLQNNEIPCLQNICVVSRYRVT